MVTGLSWATYLDAVARLAVVEPGNVDYLALAPQMINYAELRICRDLDLLETTVALPGTSLVANQRFFTLPTTTVGGSVLVTTSHLNVITPAGTAVPDLGTRHALVPVSRSFLDTVYGGLGTAGVPRYFAMHSQVTVLLGPWPDAGYAVEIVGTVRKEGLSASNSSTYISTTFPDLLLMASMVWISGYQRNFGRQSDDPQMAVSYESQYQTLLKSALVEEARKRFDGTNHTAEAPTPIAGPSP